MSSPQSGRAHAARTEMGSAHLQNPPCRFPIADSTTLPLESATTNKPIRSFRDCSILVRRPAIKHWRASSPATQGIFDSIRKQNAGKDVHPLFSCFPDSLFRCSNLKSQSELGCGRGPGAKTFARASPLHAPAEAACSTAAGLRSRRELARLIEDTPVILVSPKLR